VVKAKTMNTLRVLVFGSTGTGKTSLCNTLTGKGRPTDNGAKGITAKSHLYPPFDFNGSRIEVIDTVGLHESSHGTVPAEQAVLELVELLNKAKDGFNLLIHVTRASRITQDHDEDYTFFVEKMTQKQIPVILAVTGCENELPMQGWVERNQEAFKRFNYREILSCCFASGGPMEGHYQPLREQSRDLLLKSIATQATQVPVKIYGEGTDSTFNEALTRIWNEFVTLAGLPEKYRRQVNESVYQLMNRLGVPKTIADAAIKHIPDLLKEIGDKTPVPGGGKILKKLSEFVLRKTIGRWGQ
jgi:energy-coupling factor transporter ATP-binding protein EcfA2